MPRRASSLLFALVLSGCSDRATRAEAEPPSTSAAASATVPAAPVASEAPPPAPSASAPPVDPDARQVELHVRDAVVGDVVHERVKIHSELDGSVVLKTIHMVSDEDTERDIEILATSGGVVTKVKLTYTRVARTRTIDGAAKPNLGAVEGRSYVVERSGGPLRIDPVDAKPLTEPEEAEIKGSMASLGKQDGVAKTLASKPRRVGERLDDVARAMIERYDADRADTEKNGDHSALSGVVVTLVGVESVDGHDVAVLEVTSTTKGVRDGAESTLETKGRMSFRLDTARVVHATADGLSTMKKGIMSGSGKMTMTTDAASRPKDPRDAAGAHGSPRPR